MPTMAMGWRWPFVAQMLVWFAINSLNNFRAF